MRRTLAFAFIAVIALTGCEEDNNAAALCTAICDCGSILPSEYSRCIAGCTEDIPDEVPPACAECVLSASCAGLLNDACDFECAAPDPEENP